LRSGSNLEEVTSQLAERFGVGVNVIPATSDPVRTWVEAADGETAPRVTPSEATPSNPMPVSAPIRYEGADQAMASARAVASIMQASRVILAPSDPVRVWDAMLAIPGLRDAIRRTKAVKIAISPIAGSQPLTGDGAELERLMKATGSAQVSVADLATRYRDVLGDLVIHTTDVDALDAVRAAGVGAWAENILIGNPEDAARLARRLVSQERGMSGAG
jgi:LPPG:FO 2-phospho-L-lactate transferase